MTGKLKQHNHVIAWISFIFHTALIVWFEFYQSYASSIYQKPKIICALFAKNQRQQLPSRDQKEPNTLKPLSHKQISWRLKNIDTPRVLAVGWMLDAIIIQNVKTHANTQIKWKYGSIKAKPKHFLKNVSICLHVLIKWSLSAFNTFLQNVDIVAKLWEFRVGF